MRRRHGDADPWIWAARATFAQRTSSPYQTQAHPDLERTAEGAVAEIEEHANVGNPTARSVKRPRLDAARFASPLLGAARGCTMRAAEHLGRKGRTVERSLVPSEVGRGARA